MKFSLQTSNGTRQGWKNIFSSGGRLISDWESRGQRHSPLSLYFFWPEKKNRRAGRLIKDWLRQPCKVETIFLNPCRSFHVKVLITNHPGQNLNKIIRNYHQSLEHSATPP